MRLPSEQMHSSPRNSIGSCTFQRRIPFTSSSWRRQSTQHTSKRRHCIVECEKNLDSLTEEIQSGLDAQAKRDKLHKKQTKQFKEYNEKIKELASKVQTGLQGTSIYLVGMMGSGKTTVGKMLASALQYPFLDVDSLTEQTAQVSIAEIFATEGEESFRELETATLKELMAFKSVVVSTGGGAVLKRLNWGYMQHGIVVWLSGSPELLAHRAIKDDMSQRPLLSQADGAEASEEEQLRQTTEKLTNILNDREGKYAQADIKVPLHDHNSGPAGASAAHVTFRVLKAINDRIQGDKKTEPQPEPQFKGFGKPPSAKHS